MSINRIVEQRNELTVSKANKAETAMTFRLLIHEHHSFFNLAELTEVSLHLVNRRVLWYTTDENLLRLVSCLGSILWCCMLRINLLSIQCVDWNLQNFLNSIRFLFQWIIKTFYQSASETDIFIHLNELTVNEMNPKPLLLCFVQRKKIEIE